MTYDITTKTAPAMPKLGKGLDFVRYLQTCVNLSLRHFLMLQQLISVQLNFCIQTNLGRNFVA